MELWRKGAGSWATGLHSPMYVYLSKGVFADVVFKQCTFWNELKASKGDTTYQARKETQNSSYQAGILGRTKGSLPTRYSV